MRPGFQPKEAKQQSFAAVVNSTFHAYIDSLEVEQNTNDCDDVLDGHHGLDCDNRDEDKLEDKTVPPDDDYGKA